MIRLIFFVALRCQIFSSSFFRSSDVFLPTHFREERWVFDFHVEKYGIFFRWVYQNRHGIYQNAIKSGLLSSTNSVHVCRFIIKKCLISFEIDPGQQQKNEENICLLFRCFRIERKIKVIRKCAEKKKPNCVLFAYHWKIYVAKSSTNKITNYSNRFVYL